MDQYTSDSNSTCCCLWVCCVCALLPGSCGTPPGGSNEWLDSSTPGSACSKTVCTGSYQQCSSPAAATEDLVLVFSDEFSSPNRDFKGQSGDKKWTAMDMYYSSDYREWQNYKPDKVAVVNGSLQLAFANETTEGMVIVNWMGTACLMYCIDMDAHCCTTQLALHLQCCQTDVCCPCNFNSWQ